MVKYDAILVGSGQAANPLAKRLASAGWKTALIERQWVGGTCVNAGCTPSKTLIATGRVAALVRRSAEFGIGSAWSGPDMDAVVRRKNSIVLASREGSTRGLIGTPNLDLIFGAASFSASKEITVVAADGSAQTVTADYIFLDTGAQPFIPPVPGLEKISYLTSSSILDLREVPAHLAIIGGSYIALEFGQLYRRLGSQVTIIEEHDHFLSKEDDDVAAEIRKILEEDGIRIYTSTKVTSVVAGNPVRLDLTYSPETAPEPVRPDAQGQAGPGPIPPGFLTASHVLVAAGRRPDTAGLNTAAAGIRLHADGSIAVNGRLETNVPGIFALGDVKGGPQFTHVSYNDYLIVSRNLLDHANLSTEGRLPLYCLFTDPELGRVGLTEKEARAKGLEVKVACLPAAHVARAVENSETRGLLKVIAGAGDGKILGAAMLITGGGELMSIVQMAMAGGLTTDKVRDMMYAHPTFAESLNNLFAKL